MSLTKRNYRQLDMMWYYQGIKKESIKATTLIKIFLSFDTHCSLFTSFKYFTILNKKIVHFIFDSVVLPCHSCAVEKDLPFYVYRNVYHPSSNYKEVVIQNKTKSHLTKLHFQAVLMLITFSCCGKDFLV